MQRGDIYFAPFPYTDLAHTKPRPVCIVSDSGFNTGIDVVVAMITSKSSRRTNPGVGDFAVVDWQQAESSQRQRFERVGCGRAKRDSSALVSARSPKNDIARLDQALTEVLEPTASRLRDYEVPRSER